MAVLPQTGRSDLVHGAAAVRLTLEGSLPVQVGAGDLLKALSDLLKGERAPLERPE